MKELSLNILDITENSTKAEATLIEILLDETEETLELRITDNGKGMKEEVLRGVENPFYTTRTTRKVGLGIPFLKLQAEMTEGSFSISSRYIEDFPEDHGTQVVAVFNKNHIDYTPLGDIVETIITLIQGHPETDFKFSHNICGKTVGVDTRELREQLGDIPLNEYEVIIWVKEYLNEQYSEALQINQ